MVLRSPYDGKIDVDFQSPAAYTRGKVHRLAPGRSLEDRVVKFETSWKVLGKRYRGCLSLRVEQKHTCEHAGAIHIKGKYNSGVTKRVTPIKVIEFVGFPTELAPARP